MDRLNRARGLSALLAIVGCTVPEGATPDVPAAEKINGHIVAFDSWLPFAGHDCSNAELATIGAGAAAARYLLVDRRADFTACLVDSVMSCDDHAWPEQVFAQLAADTTTFVDCQDVEHGLAYGPSSIAGEKVVFDHDYLADVAADPNGIASVAGILMHEVLHNRGYSHHAWPDTPEHAQCVNEQAHTCAYRMLRDDLDDGPNGVPRSAGRGEVELSPVGRGGGTPFAFECFDGRSVGSLSLRVGTRIDALGLSCRSHGVLTSAESYAAVGNVGTGWPVTQGCAAGEVAVGAAGVAETQLNGIGLLCARESDVREGRVTPARAVAQNGGTTGLAWRRECPTGMALTGVRGRADASAGVHRVRLVCRSLARPASRTHAWSHFGPATGVREELELCPGDAALVSFIASAGSNLDRLAGACAPVTSECTSAGCSLRTNRAGILPMIAGHGGWAGGNVSQGCRGPDVLVGLEATFENGRIDGVRGLCANLTEWTRRGAVAPPVTRAAESFLGGGAGSIQSTVCPRGEVLAGYRIGTAGGLVQSLTPRCRPMAAFECPPNTSCVYTLEVARAGLGSGTVTSDVGGIACGGACTARLAAGSVVTLTAAPQQGSELDHWESCGTVGSNGTCRVELGSVAATRVTAHFRVVETYDCYPSCFAACRAEGLRAAVCRAMCTAECSD